MTTNEEHEKIYKQLFGNECEKKQTGEFDFLENAPIIEPINSIQIDNITIKCDNLILGAKIMCVLRNHNIHKEDFDFEDGKAVIEALNKLKP